MKMNRKGDLAITLFVILTMALVASSTMVFYMKEKDINNKLTNQIKSPTAVFNLYAQRDIISFYVYSVLRKSAIDSYNKIVIESTYIDNSCQNIGGRKVFCMVNSELAKIQSFDVQKGFSNDFKMQEIKDRLKEHETNLELKSENIAFRQEQDKFKILIKDINLSFTKLRPDNTLDIYLKHTFDIEQAITLDEIGLSSFDKILRKINECKITSDFKACLKFDNFDASTSELEIDGRKYYNITLISKDKFFIDNSLKEIKINFIVDA